MLGDQCRNVDLPECVKAANDLNVIIQDQSYFIIDLTNEFMAVQKAKDSIFAEKQKAAVELQKLKNKKVPFYRNPWYYLIAGFIGGVFAAK